MIYNTDLYQIIITDGCVYRSNCDLQCKKISKILRRGCCTHFYNIESNQSNNKHQYVKEQSDSRYSYCTNKKANQYHVTLCDTNRNKYVMESYMFLIGFLLLICALQAYRKKCWNRLLLNRWFDNISVTKLVCHMIKLVGLRSNIQQFQFLCK